MKKWLQYYLPVAITLFMCVTIQRIVVTDGGYDRLYGLPFPYISNSYATSMSYDVYALAMIVNLLFYFILTAVLFNFIERKIIKLKTHSAALILGVAISVFWIVIFVFITRDSAFYFLNHTEYKTTGREFIFGLRP